MLSTTCRSGKLNKVGSKYSDKADFNTYGSVSYWAGLVRFVMRQEIGRSSDDLSKVRQRGRSLAIHATVGVRNIAVTYSTIRVFREKIGVQLL